jgi:FMN phosphatase YigB (HAD superfamily)
MLHGVLVDVGGTLWPDRLTGDRSDERILAGLEKLLPGITSEGLAVLRAALRDDDQSLVQNTLAVLGDAVRSLGADCSVEDLEAIRRVLCGPAVPGVALFPGACELLETIHGLGLRCVVLSNVQVRGAAEYWRDFDDLGVAPLIHAIVTSLDVGFRKPHPAMFEAGLREAGCPAGACLMIGDSEFKDIQPAVGLGMRAIRVAIETPQPATTAAHAVATSLSQAGSILMEWAAAPRCDWAVDSETVTLEALSTWCQVHLGSGVDALLFDAGFATRVHGLRLSDGREVVVRVRPFTPRLRGTAAVHAHLWQNGFACPQPLVALEPYGALWISAESLVRGGHVLAEEPNAPELYASALANLVSRAPAPEQVPSLVPPPGWLRWDHTEPGLWPRSEPAGIDLNLLPSPKWLRDAARGAREQLRTCSEPPVVGHADWWSQNLRWKGHRLHVAFDWDSVTAQPEAIIAGAAAYQFAATTFEIEGSAPAATAAESERFLRAYARARGTAWTGQECQVAWSASIWVACYQAQLSAVEAVTGAFADQVRRDLPERIRHAGLP